MKFLQFGPTVSVEKFVKANVNVHTDKADSPREILLKQLYNGITTSHLYEMPPYFAIGAWFRKPFST